MKSFYDLVHERRSVRSYNDKPVPEEANFLANVAMYRLGRKSLS